MTFWILPLALAMAVAFEIVNGFNDTANAVATVIYTKSLKPTTAVVLSGIFNFLGVYLGGMSVAFAIVYLLPVDLLISTGSNAGLAMVLSLLLAAIAWNLGTWFLALPSSSSHALIGAILGVGLATSVGSSQGFGSGVNWSKAIEIGLSLLISPILGFVLAALLLWLWGRLLPVPDHHRAPVGDEPPGWTIRGLLVLTCTGVSLAHGSNDGQKGIGLVMLILIGLLPQQFALNGACTQQQIVQAAQATIEAESYLKVWPADVVEQVLTRARLPRAASIEANAPLAGPVEAWPLYPFDQGMLVGSDRASLVGDVLAIREALTGLKSTSDLPHEKRWAVRTRILRLNYGLARLQYSGRLEITPLDSARLKGVRAQFREITDYAPLWVTILVATALATGTMLGWRRIVVTVGEKIGKTQMTYSQGASAGVVAMSAIGLAGFLGLPVSTTHVLASGVAGTMVVRGGGVQGDTVRKIVLAWVFTLPACTLLGGSLFCFFRWILG